MGSEMKVAKFVRVIVSDPITKQDARLYELPDRIAYVAGIDNEIKHTHFIIVSAAVVGIERRTKQLIGLITHAYKATRQKPIEMLDPLYEGPETYIFAVDSDGNVLSWKHLPGSYQGGLSHETALNGMGHTMIGQGV